MMFFSIKSSIHGVESCQISRNEYLLMSDSELLEHCRIESYVGSGPGGQHRNRNYTAVRLTLKELPQLTAEDSVSRSQKQNVTLALQKLRIAIACSWREKSDDIVDYQHLNSNNPAYPYQLALLLDVTLDSKFDHKLAALKLGLSNSKYLKELAREAAVWQQFQSIRTELGLFELKLPRS